jgi:radical SAM superfamily enzyme YgiQ (UPF0313 family)
MINGSFVFGMDDDDESVFARTVEWAVQQGVETATFHIMTPYPGTALYERLAQQGRLLHSNWDLYDTRHVVYRPARLSPAALEMATGVPTATFTPGVRYSRARTHSSVHDSLRHIAYAGGWKKFEPLWDVIIRAKRATNMLPVLEQVLASFGGQRPTAHRSKAHGLAAHSPEVHSGSSLTKSQPPVRL